MKNKNTRQWLNEMTADERAFVLNSFPRSLAEQGNKERLQQLLTDFVFLEAKVTEYGVQEVLTDYELAKPLFKGKIVVLLQDSLRLLTDVIENKPGEFPSQLWGALARHNSLSVQKLLNGAIKDRRQAEQPCWLRPLEPCLISGGGPLLQTLMGHQGRVQSIAITPDGKKFISVGSDPIIRIWEIETAKRIEVIKVQAEVLDQALLSHDGTKIITVSTGEGIVFVHELETGKQLQKFAIEHPERKMIREATEEVAAFEQNEFMMPFFEQYSAKNLAENLPVTSIALMGEHQILVGYENGLLCCYDIANGETVSTKELYGSIQTLAVSNAAHPPYFASGSPCEITIYHPTGERSDIRFEWERRLGKMLFSKDDKILFLVAGAGVELWDIQQRVCVRTLASEQHSPYSSIEVTDFALSPDGSKLITASADILTVWDWQTGQQLALLEGHLRQIKAVTITPDSKLVISGDDDGAINIWKFDTLAGPEAHLPHQGIIHDITISKDGRVAVSGGQDNKINIWNILEREVIHAIDVNKETEGLYTIETVAITPDGKKIVSGGSEQTIRVWDAMTGKSLKTLYEAVSLIETVQVTPDGNYAVSGSWDYRYSADESLPDKKTILVWKLAESQEGNWFSKIFNYNDDSYERSIGGHYAQVNSLLIKPDGKTVFTGGDANAGVIAWDFNTGKKVFELKDISASALALTPDNEQLLIADSLLLQVWNIKTKELERPFGKNNPYVGSVIGSHEANITDVAVTSDGRYAISTSVDRMIKIWDMETREEVASFTAQGELYSCAIAPNDQTILVGDSLGRVYFFYLETVQEA